MGFLSGACPKCGGRVSNFAKFCAACGEASGGLFRSCAKCSKVIKASSKFCSGCGDPVKLEGAAAAYPHVWRRVLDPVGFKEVEAAIRPEATEALAAVVRSRPAAELDLSATPHVDAEGAMRARMKQTLDRLGLELIQVRTFMFRSAALEKERDL